MDGNYDIAAAAQKLEELSLDRYKSAHSGTQLSRIASVTAHYEAIPNGKSWVLVLRNTSEELVISFQGVIAKKDLPPFTQKLGRSSQQIRYLRQSVTITGLNSETFAKVINAIGEIHAVLGRAVGMNNVSECGMIGSLDEKRVVELANRYFKPRSSASSQDEIVLSVDIDPHGHLAQAAKASGMYHSEENVVQYFERRGVNDDDYRYELAKPVIFDVGDIVEVQASFVAFPLKEGKYKSAMVLRGLTLLDGSFTQARIRNMVVHIAPPPVSRSIKRKVGYGDEQMSSARAKLMKMDLDEQPKGISSNVGSETHALDDTLPGSSHNTLD